VRPLGLDIRALREAALRRFVARLDGFFVMAPRWAEAGIRFLAARIAAALGAIPRLVAGAGRGLRPVAGATAHPLLRLFVGESMP
jgi:hypothetical protein